MAAIRRDQPTTVPWLYLCCVLLLSNLLVYQWASTNSSLDDSYHAYALLSSTTKHVDSGADPYGSSASDGVSSTPAEVLRNPLVVPRGEAVPLPSIRTAKDESVTTQRSIYGGAGDKKHLGGFTDIDTGGISPRAWKWMVQRMNIHSVLDVGCGRGISTTWFHFHGLQVLCVEGSHDARERTLLPDPDTQMVEHDFARGPWWPGRTFDAVWCVEFLEHVGRDFHKNYLPAFRKAGLIFVTHSINGGWHHVEVHRKDWWITKMEFYGFRHMTSLTTEIRTLVWNETHAPDKGVAPNGKPIGAPHIHANMLVFVNPLVTALPEHAHLYYEPGCFLSRSDGVLTQRDCGEGPSGNLETPLPPEYKPLVLTKEQDDKWFEWVKARVKPYVPEGRTQ